MEFYKPLKILAKREFKNGFVYALELSDGYVIETTFTWLPFYTKNAINENSNCLKSNDLGSWKERTMIGVSVMSGCPVRCKFCATAKLKKWRNLTCQEIIEQVRFILLEHPYVKPEECQEFKINYTRMGETFLNVEEVKKAVEGITNCIPNAHHYISTIGIKGSDFSWIKGNITLQLSLHSLDEKRRDNLIPFNRKLSIQELGQVRTDSNLQTTLNLTLVDEADFDINKLLASFDPKKFFVKLSPVNENSVSKKNHIGKGIISSQNIE